MLPWHTWQSYKLEKIQEETWASRWTNGMKARSDSTSARRQRRAMIPLRPGFVSCRVQAASARLQRHKPRRLSVPATACQNKSVPSCERFAVDGVPSCAVARQYRFRAIDDCAPPCVLGFDAWSKNRSAFFQTKHKKASERLVCHVRWKCGGVISALRTR